MYKLITDDGNYLIYSLKYGHAVYYQILGENKYKKVLKIFQKGAKEFELRKSTWGKIPTELEKGDENLLERTAPFRRKIDNLAIRKPKDESSILGTSEFFKTEFGLLIIRAHGKNGRKQRTVWNLFNFEPLTLKKRPLEGRNEPVNFGTFDGHAHRFAGMYTSYLIPISQNEWEELAGRKYNVYMEFGWFGTNVQRYTLAQAS